MVQVFESKELEKVLRQKRDLLGEKVLGLVSQIIEQVKKDKDKALIELTKKLDGVELDSLKVPEKDISAARSNVKKDYLEALSKARKNISAYHEKQKETEWIEPLPDDVVLGMRHIPIEVVGIYVPGGKASYPSSVLMNAIPAKVAGVPRIVMASPPPVSPSILAAANELGIKEVYQVGGAQAIAALAYGTESVPKVDKVVGPGNIYVMAAKKLLFGVVGIESLAGPSDILVIADDDSEAQYIAADLLAQAEHDPNSKALLLTNSKKVAEAVKIEVQKQVKRIKRQADIKFDNIMIFVTRSIDEAVELANKVAPEHLSLMVGAPQKILEKIKNAGAVFLGPYSPVAVGDYIAGPNHVLPTGGTARFSSPLGVYDFIKRQSIIGYTKPALKSVMKDIKVLAEMEGLDAHAKSVEIRFRS